jgi:protein-S-isoprenylcysteine O-methyltransferase Ste14
MAFMRLGWPLLSAVLLLALLASFGWAMRSFFSKPAGDNASMRVVRICGSAFAILHLFAILITPVAAPQALAGACFYFGAFGLFWWAIRTNLRQPLSAVFSPDSPNHLVQDGPYRWIRHPFYCSYMLTWLAGVVATGRLWLLPTVAVMLVLYLKAARIEEDKFGSSPLALAYERYRARTGLFFPNPAKWAAGRKEDADAAGLA